MIKSLHFTLKIPTALRPTEKPKRQIRTPFILQRNSSTNYPEYQKSGSWKKSQLFKYTLFLQYFYKVFQNKENIKKFKIFSQMSSFISTRNQNQCRSHHQKIMQQYGSAFEYLEFFSFDLKRTDSEIISYKYQLQKIKQTISSFQNENFKSFGFAAFQKEDNRLTDEDYKDESFKENEKTIKINVSEHFLKRFSSFQSDQKKIQCSQNSNSAQIKNIVSFDNLNICSFTGYDYLGLSAGLKAIKQEKSRNIEKKEEYFTDFRKNLQSMYIKSHNNHFS